MCVSMGNPKQKVAEKAESRYELGEILGQGSMGIVYRAYDRLRDRWVACKTVSKEASDRHCKSLRREIELLRDLQHEGILPLYDAGQWSDGRPYYTMKQVKGMDLAQWMERETIPMGLAVRFLIDICQTLSHAHRKGTIHCDLKPSNILLDPCGEALGLYVIDWGTSETRIQGEKKSRQSGYLVNGTPLYIAPEVLRGEEPDGRADQYALGVILYELLTRQYPFHEQDILSLFQKVCCEPVQPPSERAPDAEIPWDLELICLRLLSKNPAHRFASCEELAAALEAWLETEARPSHSIAEPRPVPRFQRPRWFAAPLLA